MKQWFTSRTVGEVYIIRETYGVYTSPRLLGLVKQWFTSRTNGELHVQLGTIQISPLTGSMNLNYYTPSEMLVNPCKRNKNESQMFLPYQTIDTKNIV